MPRLAKAAFSFLRTSVGVVPVLFGVIRGQLHGSYDQCNDDTINWTEVNATILTWVQGRNADANFQWVRALAMRGPPEDSESDCWYGWVALRFFALTVLSGSDLNDFLQNGEELEYTLWLQSPWREMLMSDWDILSTLVAAARAMRANANLAPDFDNMLISSCSLIERQFFDQVGKALTEGNQAAPSPEIAWAAVELLVSSPTEAFTSLSTYLEPCTSHAKATAVLILGLRPALFHHVTPGYALRATQGALRASNDRSLASILTSPWPMLPMLNTLWKHLRGLRSRPDASSEDDLTDAVVKSSRMEFPSVPASFLPPASRDERLRLLESLQVVHRVLEVARIPYVAMTGTLLGAIRHHGFVPWDGDADVCLDIRDEPDLLRLALLQRHGPRGGVSAPSRLRLASRLLTDSGFEVFAHADRPLTYKLSGLQFPRVPGRPYGYPYMDLWFCHGWSEGTFSMQSAEYGVPIPREYVFPRRKVFFAGLPLWAFGDPWGALSAYYGEGWFDECVGHETFHRQERKYSDKDEQDRFNGRVPCRQLSSHFAFAAARVPGLPEGLTVEILITRLRAWFFAKGRASWLPTLDVGHLSGAAIIPEPTSFRGDWDGRLEPVEVINASTSDLLGPEERLVHKLSDVSISARDTIVGNPSGDITCDLILRLVPIARELDIQLIGAFVPASDLSPLFMEQGDSSTIMWRLEVSSCLCRRNLQGLILEWAPGDT